jgi:hypothetical protein
MKPFSWKCPYCNQNATIGSSDVHESSTTFTIKNAEGPRELYSFFIVCPNEECKKYTLSVLLFETKRNMTTYEWETGKLIRRFDLIPKSDAKVFPDYVPRVIIEDYEEACLILNDSPKASATLARRCLQGMIRDFWKIKKGRLIDEINAIEELVDPLTWKSIDAIRKIGNIGAHMEKDINLIIDVDPNEARILLQLIEQLIEEWYINRHEKEKRLKAIIDISKDKDDKKKGK